MKFFDRITVAVANAAPDDELLGYARLIRDICDLDLQFVHVLPLAGLAEAPSTPVPSHKEALAALQSRIDEYFGPGNTSCHVVTGSRVDKLLEFAAESRSDCILVGHRRGRTGRRSVGRRLAMKAPCSVWMVPEGSAKGISRLLVAVDFSSHSAYALSFATLLANGAGAHECTALHVQSDALRALDESLDHTVRENSHRAFGHFLAPLDLHGVEVRPRVEQSGSVPEVIERVADEEAIDLIVMGTRGRSPSAAVLLGSESEQMLTETTRPVLVTKHRGERLGLLEVLLDRGFHTQQEPQFG